MSEKHFTIKKAEDETTEIICILDRSTSIRTSGLIEKTIEGFNAFLSDQKKQASKAKLTLCLFDGGTGYGNTGTPGETYEMVHNGVDIQTVPELNKDTFVPKGMTAMYDAIGITIDNVSKRINETKAEDRPDKVVILIMTDGEENSSKEYNQKTVFESIQKYKTENKWAFIFIGANIDTMRAGHGIGVSAGNTLAYTNTGHGVDTAYMNMSMSVSRLRSSSSDLVGFTGASGSAGFAGASGALGDTVNLDSLIVDNGAEKENI